VTAQPLYLRLSSFYFAYFLMLGAFAPFFGLYLKDLGFASLQIGVLLAIMPVVRTALPTVWGWIADHHGHRRALIRLTSVAAAVACAGLLLATSFPWLFAVLLLLNVFWCAALPLVEATTFGLLQGRLGDYGRIRVWGSVSFVLAVLAIGPALDRAGVGILPAVLVILFAVVAASTWLLPADETPAHHEEHVSLGRILRRPEVVALFVACFLMSLAHGPYNSFYSIHLVDLGYSKTAVSWLWTMSVVAEIGVFLWMPHLLKRVSIANVIAVSLGCAVVRFLLIGWLARAPAVLAAAQLLHAATFGAHHAAALAAVHHFFRGRFQARGQGLYTALGFGAGGAAGAVLSGWLWDHVGAGLTFTFGAAAALVALVVVLARLRLPTVAHAGA
jgi:MFS transporter, PPP family, 3-phenylpropionic acid transporter